MVRQRHSPFSFVVSPLPDRLALAGVVAAGFGWSLSVGWACWTDVADSGFGPVKALTLVTAGGMATVLSLWFAVAAVMWAMGRACGFRPGFRDVLMTLSASGPVLVLVAPAVASLMAGGETAPSPLSLFLFAVGGAVFCLQVARGLGRYAHAPAAKAWGCIALTGVFCASFLSLYQ